MDDEEVKSILLWKMLFFYIYFLNIWEGYDWNYFVER